MVVSLLLVHFLIPLHVNEYLRWFHCCKFICLIPLDVSECLCFVVLFHFLSEIIA